MIGLFVTAGVMVLLTLVFIGISCAVFWVLMLVDCITRDFEGKLIWVVIILLGGFVGSLIYYFMIKSRSGHPNM